MKKIIITSCFIGLLFWVGCAQSINNDLCNNVTEGVKKIDFTLFKNLSISNENPKEWEIRIKGAPDTVFLMKKGIIDENTLCRLVIPVYTKKFIPIKNIPILKQHRFIQAFKLFENLKLKGIFYDIKSDIYHIAAGDCGFLYTETPRNLTYIDKAGYKEFVEITPHLYAPLDQIKLK